MLQVLCQGHESENWFEEEQKVKSLHCLDFFNSRVHLESFMACLFSGMIREEWGVSGWSGCLVQCVWRCWCEWGSEVGIFFLLTKVRRLALITPWQNRHNAILLSYPSIHCEYIKHGVGSYAFIFEWGLFLTVLRVLPMVQKRILATFLKKL